MANAEHLKILKEGVERWNSWREEEPEVRPDLSCIDLQGWDLPGVNLSNSSLTKANLSNANLATADFSNADLTEADLSGAFIADTFFIRANLSGSNFTKSFLTGALMKGADFSDANLLNAVLYRGIMTECKFYNTDLRGADLSESDLSRSSFIQSDLTNANITGAYVYGIGVWDVQKEGLAEKDLVIVESGKPEITVDDLEIAQFIYLLLNNQKFRDVIETVTSKAVLILGRFTEERKKTLDAIRDELRNRNFLPILFDFEKPDNRDLTETVSILAKLSRFVIVDLTDPNSVPHELATLVPVSRSLPFASIMLKGQKPYPLFQDFSSYSWVLPTFEYESEAHLIENLTECVIEPAEKKVQEIRSK